MLYILNTRDCSSGVDHDYTGGLYNNGWDPPESFVPLPVHNRGLYDFPRSDWCFVRSSGIRGGETTDSFKYRTNIPSKVSSLVSLSLVYPTPPSTLQMSPLIKFLAKSLGDPSARIAAVEESLTGLEAYINSLPAELNLRVFLTGSYATGLSLDDSDVNVVFRLGGETPRSLDPEQLADAIRLGFSDCGVFKQIEKVPGPGLEPVLLCTLPTDSVMRVIAVNSDNFPLADLFSAKLVLSYCRLHSSVSLFLLLVKSWGRQYKPTHSGSPVPSPLTGFHWTMIGLYFLVEFGLVPNLSSPAGGADRDIYGPIPEEHSFGSGCGQEFKISEIPLAEIFRSFFLFLSKFDLLSRPICLQNAGQSTPINPRLLAPGWLTIIHPTSPKLESVVPRPEDQKFHVKYGMLLQRHAAGIYDRIQKSSETEMVEIVFRSSRQNRINVSI
jgi:hypothetical protein